MECEGVGPLHRVMLLERPRALLTRLPELHSVLASKGLALPSLVIQHRDDQS